MGSSSSDATGANALGFPVRFGAGEEQTGKRFTGAVAQGLPPPMGKGIVEH